MTLRLGEIVMDCADHEAVVAFWLEAMGDYRRVDVNEQYVAIAPTERAVGRPAILFQKVPEREDGQEPRPHGPARRVDGGRGRAARGARRDVHRGARAGRRHPLDGDGRPRGQRVLRLGRLRPRPRRGRPRGPLAWASSSTQPRRPSPGRSRDPGTRRRRPRGRCRPAAAASRRPRRGDPGSARGRRAPRRRTASRRRRRPSRHPPRRRSGPPRGYRRCPSRPGYPAAVAPVNANEDSRTDGTTLAPRNPRRQRRSRLTASTLARASR